MKGKLTTYSSDIVLVLLGLGCFNGVSYTSLITIVAIILAVLDIMFPRYANQISKILEETKSASESDNDESEAEAE